MNVASLFNRFRTSTRKPAAALRTRPRRRIPLGQSLRVEPLEQRAMLSVSTAYVDDTWEMVEDVAPTSAVSVGDLVNNDISGNGSVAATYGVNAFGNVSSGPPTGSVTGNDEIADAIAATSAGGETRVLAFSNSAALSVTSPIMLSGEFTIPSGDLELDHADAVLAPGAGSSGGETGVITLDDGDLTLTAGTLYVRIDENGASQIQVDGTVDLSSNNVKLVIADGDFSASASTPYTIIASDGVSGTFAGLGEGATVYAGDREFTISYLAGGDDIQLTRVTDSASLAFATYVNTRWGGSQVGQTVAYGTFDNDNIDFQPSSNRSNIETSFQQQTADGNGFNTSGWDTISQAIDNTAAGGSVTVLGPIPDDNNETNNVDENTSIDFPQDVTLDQRVVLQGPFNLVEDLGESVEGSLTATSGSNATILVSRHGGTIELDGDLTLDASTVVMMTAVPAGAPSGADLIQVAGDVNLNGAQLDVIFAQFNDTTLLDGKIDPNSGVITLLEKTSAGAINGTFAGLPERARLTLNGTDFWITYTGGVGSNDVQLVPYSIGTSSVVGRHIFYNDSFFDGNSSAINTDDDAAIDPSKTAYIPGGDLAIFNNVTGYSKGINGIMIDLDGGGDHASITANDFFFSVGNNNAPETWDELLTPPAAVSVRPNTPTTGVDRVEITWADNVIEKEWLAVHVLSTINTGLATPDLFFWGNAVGDSGDGDTGAGFGVTAAADEIGARNNPHNFLDPVAVDYQYDYNKDSFVTGAGDEVVARNNTTTFLNWLLKIDILANPVRFQHLFAPDVWTPGKDVTLVVSAPLGDKLPDEDVDGVNFYHDADGNGVITAAENTPLGSGATLQNGDVYGWSFTFDPVLLGDGAFSVIPVPVIDTTEYLNSNPTFRGRAPYSDITRAASLEPILSGTYAASPDAYTDFGSTAPFIDGLGATPESPSLETATIFSYQATYSDDEQGNTAERNAAAINQLGSGYAMAQSHAFADKTGNEIPHTYADFDAGNAAAVFTVASDSAPVGAPVSIVVRLLTSAVADSFGAGSLSSNGGVASLNSATVTWPDSIGDTFQTSLMSARSPDFLNSVPFNDLRSARVIYARVGDTISIDYSQANTDAWVVNSTNGIAEANESFQFRLDAR